MKNEESISKNLKIAKCSLTKVPNNTISENLDSFALSKRAPMRRQRDES